MTVDHQEQAEEVVCRSACIQVQQRKALCDEREKKFRQIRVDDDRNDGKQDRKRLRRQGLYHNLLIS